MNLPPDFVDLLEAFEADKVKYLVVGGYAVALHGAPRFTKDLDLLVGTDDSNLRAATDALKRFGAPSTVIEAFGNLVGLDVAWMGNPPVRIDLMKTVPGIEFESAYTRRRVVDWQGISIAVISKEDLIQAKLASARPQDLVDVEHLRAG